jgi:pimeloyl-ACP methyl ester carboxylesterase
MEKIRIYRNVQKLTSVDIFYMDTKTDGPTILCLHGRWGRAETWYDFIQHYGSRYRIIAPDQRGHGLSTKPISKYTAEEMSEDMAELLASLQIGQAIVVGHSMGGRIAGYLAACHPELVTKVAILDKSAAGSAGSDLPPLDAIPADPLTKDWPMPFPSIYEAMEFLHREMETDFSYQYFMNSLVEDVEGYRMMFSSQAMAANVAYDQSWFHLLPAIHSPALLVRSSSHEAVSDEDFQQMQALLGDCTAREVSHPDHNVHLSRKEEFYRYFDEFLLKAD